MQLVDIDAVTPGQIVASAVTSEAGAILLPAGFRLTERSITKLKCAGVAAVIIIGPMPLAEEVEKRIERIESRFSKVEDPILLQIKAAVVNRLRFMKLGLEGE